MASRCRAALILLIAACGAACGAAAATTAHDIGSSETGDGRQVFTARADISGAGRLLLRYRINFESSLHEAAMARAADGSWSATLGPSDVAPGSLIRYSIVAIDAGKDQGGVEGTPVVMQARQLGNAHSIPTLWWFLPDPNKARGDSPAAGICLFDARDGSGMRYYGNMTAHRSGSERHNGLSNQWGKGKSKDWDKRDYKFSFHKSAPPSSGSAFVWSAGLPPVSAIELFSFYQESGPNSYMRKTLAMRLMAANGVPVSATRYVRLVQNSKLVGLYALVELVDKSFLQRHGLNTEGRLFKADHWKYSGLRPPNIASECPFTAPDYDYWPRGQGKCPIIFEEGGQPAGSTPHLSEVENLAQQVNAGDLSHLDMANVVTEMAVQTAMLHQDRCVKNHFYFHDEASDRWLVIPYDMKDTFATDNRGNGRNCAAEGNPCGNTPTYCILSCEAFNSPYACDSSHPQDTFPESDGRSSYNHLVDAVFKKPEWKAAYFRKLWQVIDRYLASGWLQDQVAQIRSEIAADAREDDALWHAGDIDSGVKALLAQMAARKQQLYGTYRHMFSPYVDTHPASSLGSVWSPPPSSGAVLISSNASTPASSDSDN